MNAMDRSNHVLAKILNQALEKGISHWSLTFDDLELDDTYITHFFPCIEWLEAEGLIRVGSYQRAQAILNRTTGVASASFGSAENISLTARGMSVLGQKIEVSGEQMTISETARNVSAGRVNYNKIGDAIGGIIGGFTKSIGS